MKGDHVGCIFNYKQKARKEEVAWCLKHNIKIFAYGYVFHYGTQLQLLEDRGCDT